VEQSTDATAEGLNLHERCHQLIHLELPCNPNRLEQRNGRIVRYGQLSDPEKRYLYLAGTFEERLLLRLVAKYEQPQARLTCRPNTRGGITTEDAQTVRLLEGLGEAQETLFATPGQEIRQLEDAAEDDTGSTANRDLLAEVERSMAGYEKAAKTSSWLGRCEVVHDRSFFDDLQQVLRNWQADPASSPSMGLGARQWVAGSRLQHYQAAVREGWYRSLWERREALTAALLERLPELAGSGG
jgi:hypothetical protein